jgi:hypothetical protein
MTILTATLERPPTTAKPSGPDSPMGIEPVYSQRVGFNIFRSGFFTTGSQDHRESHKVSWPIGKLCLYRDHLTVGSVFRTYRIDYSCVERITPSMLFYARIDHSCPDVPDIILLRGWFLLRTLRRVASANCLRLMIG